MARPLSFDDPNSPFAACYSHFAIEDCSWWAASGGLFGPQDLQTFKPTFD
jgi:hypothetical protein